jgi:hypothetical protein
MVCVAMPDSAAFSLSVTKRQRVWADSTLESISTTKGSCARSLSDNKIGGLFF